MPLPFAPPPDESRVYDSLKSVFLSDVTPDQLDSLRQTVFAQGIDGTEDEYRRLILLMLASQAGSTSGPIAGTGTVVATDVLTSTGAVTVFQPEPGEVFQITAMSQLPVGSGSHRLIAFLTDGTDTVELFDSTASGTGEQLDFSPAPTYIDHTCYLKCNVITVDTSIQLKVAVIRVR